MSFRFGTVPDSRRRGGAAILLSGVLAALSQPLVVGLISPEPLDPTGLTGLLALVALAPALMVARRQGGARAWLTGTLVFWLHLLLVAHWLMVAFSTYGGLPVAAGFAILLVVTGSVAAGLGLSFALATSAKRRLGWPLWVTFPPALAGLELLRNYVPFGGNPWGNLGSSLATVDLLRQGASLFGVYGLVFLVALVNAAVAEAAGSWREGRGLPRLGLVVAGMALAGVCTWGGARLLDGDYEGEHVRVGVLQPSIPQELISEDDSDESIRAAYRELQAEAIALGAEVVVWPEAALAPAVHRDAQSLAGLGVVLEGEQPPPSAVVGALSYFRDLDGGRLQSGLHTSAYVTGADLKVVGRHDKTRLVPFGEVVPWPFDTLVSKLVNVAGELMPGDAPSPLPLPPLGTLEEGGGVGITICYEGVFPDVSRALVREGATQLYNLTNDAWYGVSSAPFQHLMHYRLRATETGRPLVRAANSGVSALIDARGRLLERTPLYQRVALVVDVPTATELTPYVRFGDWLAWPSLVFAALLGALLGLTALGGRSRSRYSTLKV